MKRHTPLLAAALATVALSTAPGCSLVLVKPPPQPLPQDRWVACTEYVLWPVIDIAYAALAASPIVLRNTPCGVSRFRRIVTSRRRSG